MPEAANIPEAAKIPDVAAKIPAAETPTGSAAGPRRFRPDIQGMRAIAVLLVVLYHANVPHLNAGYVGVDVFFVISGFLITGQLLREVESTGRIALLRFYGGRVRRLLPPAVVVVAGTLLAAGSGTRSSTCARSPWTPCSRWATG